MHVILEENCKNILWTTNNYFCEWFWKTEIPHVEDWNCIFISLLHKKKEKRNKNLNGKLDPIKLLQEKCGENTSRYNSKQLLPEYDPIRWWNNKWGRKWTKGCLHSKTTCPVKWEPEEQGESTAKCDSDTYAQNA